jgi:DNA-binding NarL/FixJ family response regulator
MRPLAEQARSLLSALPVDRDRRSKPLPYGLSPREIEVLRLLVDGQTDREIAMTLFISHRTVMRHVTGILNKLGVSSRTAAATRAVRDGMV